MAGSRKRYFFYYGWLDSLPYADYVNSLLDWVYEDSDERDGTIICSNEITGEFRYVEGTED